MKAVKPASDVLIRDLQRSFVGGLGYAAFLSLCVNLLLLTVPLFMMQVQDRVIVSHSLDTLTMLLVIGLGALALYGTIEFIRSLTFQTMASIFARRLNLPALQAAVSASLEQGSGQATQAIRDLNDIRYFIASCCPRQRRAKAGSMPMASIVSAWRRLAPTSLMLATPASLASLRMRRVSMSESTPSSSRMISEARPTSP